MFWKRVICLAPAVFAFPDLDFNFASRQDTISADLAASSQSIFLPWTSSFSRSSSYFPSVRGSIFGRLQTFLVDTSTTRVIVPLSVLPNVKLTSRYPSGWEYMTRQETLLTGQFATLDMTFYGRSASESAVSRVQALIVTKAVKCPGYDETTDHGVCPAGKIPAKSTPRLGKVVYLGIGFGVNGIGSDDPFSTPTHNAFLNVVSINGANSSSMRTGYIVSSQGVQLGLTPNNTAGAVWESLDKTTDPDSRAWALPLVSYTVDNSSEPVQAEALIDTSSTSMYIQSSPQVILPKTSIYNNVERVKAGTKLTFAFPDFQNGVAGYDFVVGDQEFPSQPSAVIPEESASDLVVNMGRNFLFGMTMLFDATGGRFGLICAKCV